MASDNLLAIKWASEKLPLLLLHWDPLRSSLVTCFPITSCKLLWSETKIVPKFTRTEVDCSRKQKSKPTFSPANKSKVNSFFPFCCLFIFLFIYFFNFRLFSPFNSLGISSIIITIEVNRMQLDFRTLYLKSRKLETWGIFAQALKA